MPTTQDAFEIVDAAITVNLSLIDQGFADDASIVVPYLEGEPGIGKTSIINQVGAKRGMEVEIVRLSEYEPSELAGWNLPNSDHTKMNRIIPNWIPDGSKATLIFFDEIGQGSTMSMNVIAQAVNERRVGPHKIPDNAVIVCAGNDPKHKAGTNMMPTHLRDRLTFITVAPQVDDLCNYFISVGVDTRIVGYLKWRPDHMSKFDKDAKACPSPRAWQKTDTWMKTNLPAQLKMAAIAGSLGEPVAVDFGAYLKLVTAVPDMDKLIANPTDEKLAPTEFGGKDGKGIMYAVAASLASKFNKENADNICKYLDRLPTGDIAAFVVTDVIRRWTREKMGEDAIEWPAIRKWMMKDGREYLIKGA